MDWMMDWMMDWSDSTGNLAESLGKLVLSALIGMLPPQAMVMAN